MTKIYNSNVGRAFSLAGEPEGLATLGSDSILEITQRPVIYYSDFFSIEFSISANIAVPTFYNSHITVASNLLPNYLEPPWEICRVYFSSITSNDYTIRFYFDGVLEFTVNPLLATDPNFEDVSVNINSSTYLSAECIPNTTIGTPLSRVLLRRLAT